MSAMEDKITSLSAEGKLFQPPVQGREQAWVKSMEEYKKIYAHSMEDMEGFWAKRAEELVTWDKKWDTVLEYDYSVPEFKWFNGAKLNISTNCLDRHLTDGRRNKAAIIWQGEPEEDVRVYTYQMLHDEVCRFAILRRFPYSVVYHLENEEPFVVAVAHSSRAPNYWRDRI